MTNQIRQTVASIAGVSALYSVVINNNGHVAGFALSSELLPDGSGTTSNFVVDVNHFAVGDSSISDVYPFIITNGLVLIKDAMIGNAAIDTLKLAGNAVTIPVSSYAPTTVPLSTSPQQVASVTVNFPVAPAVVNIVFAASIANGGGANGATQTRLYRNGVEIYANQDGIVNNIYSNRAFVFYVDNPGPGTHTYSVACNYAGSITSATIDSRFLGVTGAMR